MRAKMMLTPKQAIDLVLGGRAHAWVTRDVGTTVTICCIRGERFGFKIESDWNELTRGPKIQVLLEDHSDGFSERELNSVLEAALGSCDLEVGSALENIQLRNQQTDKGHVFRVVNQSHGCVVTEGPGGVPWRMNCALDIAGLALEVEGYSVSWFVEPGPTLGRIRALLTMIP